MEIIVISFLLGPMALPIIFFIKGNYHFKYLKIVKPYIFPNYDSFDQALIFKKWNSEIISLGFPWFKRYKSFENVKALKYLKIVYILLIYIFIIIVFIFMIFIIY